MNYILAQQVRTIVQERKSPCALGAYSCKLRTVHRVAASPTYSKEGIE